jgi:hypothetical protein
MGWKGVSFGPWDFPAPAEKTLDSKPGWSVAYGGNEVYITGRPEVKTEIAV